MAELQRQISSRHFAELWAEECIQPRGDERADYRAGVLAAVTANSARMIAIAHGAKIDGGGYSASDFFPSPLMERRTTNRREQLRAKLLAMKAHVEGK